MKSGSSELYIPEKGDIIWINFNPQSGREQAGRCPGLIVSSTRYNRRVGLALICPITSRIKGYPFEISIPEGLAVSGVILADQIKSLDWQTRRAEFAGKILDEVLVEVISTVKKLLGDT